MNAWPRTACEYVVLSLSATSWEETAARIAACEGPVAWAWIAARELANWETLVLTVRGATVIDNHLDRYEHVILCSEQLTPEEAAGRFRAGLTGGAHSPQLRFGPLDQTASTYWLTTAPTGVRQLVGEWPRFVADFHISTPHTPNPPGRYDPLTGPGERFHPDVMTGVAEVVYGIPPSLLGNDLSAAIRVVLPDRRARFGAVSFDAGVTAVTIEEGAPGRAAGLRLRAAWRDEADAPRWERLDIPIGSAGAVKLPTRKIPAHAAMAIVDTNGAVLDEHGWSPERGIAPADRGLPSEKVERWVSEGEGLQVEFKRDLDSESARRSFTEVVCAFANGLGGVVLIGVDDDRSVIGYDRPHAVGDQIENIIRNGVRESPRAAVEEVVVRDRRLFVVTVEPSDLDMKPHMVGAEVWLRSGATTFRASPAEVRRMMTPPVALSRTAVWA